MKAMLMSFLASVVAHLRPTDWPCRVCSGSGFVVMGVVATVPSLLYDTDGRLDLARVGVLMAIIATTTTLTGWIFLAAFKERARKIRMSDKKQFGGDIVECLHDVLPEFRALLDETYKERIEDTKAFRARAEAHMHENAERLNNIEPIIGRAAAALEFVPELRTTIANLDRTLQGNTKVMESMQAEQQKGTLAIALLRERVREVRAAQHAHYGGENNRRKHAGRREEDHILDILDEDHDDN